MRPVLARQKAVARGTLRRGICRRHHIQKLVDAHHAQRVNTTSHSLARVMRRRAAQKARRRRRAQYVPRVTFSTF